MRAEELDEPNVPVLPAMDDVVLLMHVGTTSETCQAIAELCGANRQLVRRQRHQRR